MVGMAVFSAIAVAEQAPRPQRRFGGGLYGDWIVKSDYNGRTMESILAFTRDKDGKQVGQWISFMGLTELKKLKFEDGELTFERESRNRSGETSTSKFSGTITEGKLTGTMTSSRGESKYEGARAPRPSRAVGIWAMKMTMGEREMTSTLGIKADKEGKLSAVWTSPRGARQMQDVKYERGTLTFINKPTEENSFSMNFEGQVRGDTLIGKMKVNENETAIEGKLAGAPVIGTWNLDIAAEQGTRKQRLRVNSDMSGLYGSTPIDKIVLDGDKVSFKIVLKFGDREFEMKFAGKLEKEKLTGELTTSRGSSKITGTKVIRTFGRGPGRQRPSGARPARQGSNNQ